MKTKSHFLTSVALFLATFVFAQTGQGGILLGGTASFDVPDNITSIDVSPELGFFVIDNLALGGAISIGTAKAGDVSSSSFGIAPFARYYFGASTTKFFAHAQVGYITSKTEIFGDDFTVKGSQISIGPGVAIFLNDHVAIEGILAYNKLGGDFDTDSIGFRFGVQAYLGGK
jgi:hypothetical protein